MRIVSAATYGEETIVNGVKYQQSVDENYYIASHKDDNATDISILSEVSIQGVSRPVKEIKEFAFYESANLNKIDMSESMISIIGTNAFAIVLH